MGVQTTATIPGYREKMTLTRMMREARAASSSCGRALPKKREPAAEWARRMAWACRRAARIGGRRREVFDLIGTGRSTAEIAAEMNVSVRTIESHVQRLIDALKLDNKRQLCWCAAVLAFVDGAIDGQPDEPVPELVPELVPLVRDVELRLEQLSAPVTEPERETPRQASSLSSRTWRTTAAVRRAAAIDRDSRQGQLLVMLGDLMTMAEIAAELSLSTKTVESHVSALAKSLDLRNKRELDWCAAVLAYAKRNERATAVTSGQPGR